METDRLTRKIYTNSRMELESFMHFPSGVYTGKDRKTMNVSINPILFLRYKKNQKINEEYDFTKAAFKITPKNLYDVIRFFNTIIKWLFTEEFNDLFMMNEDGEIIFNADYNKLSVSTHRGDYDQCIMQAIPTVVSIGDKKYEGIHLYINTSHYCIPLTYQEVSIIFGILKDFRFTEESILLLEAYKYIIENNSITDNDWWSPNRKTPFD